MPKTSLVQAMLVSLMRFFQLVAHGVAAAQKRGRFFRIDLVDCFFRRYSGRFSVVAESNGLFRRLFYAGFGCRADKFGAETLGKFFFKFVFY